MKATELRIGNIVNVDYGIFTKDPFVPTEITQITEENFNGGYDYTRCHGIPLTEEWLLKFGFENGNKKDFSFTENMVLRIFGYEADYNGIWFGKIDYVHQLQNIYFALTGEDLEIK